MGRAPIRRDASSDESGRWPDAPRDTMSLRSRTHRARSDGKARVVGRVGPLARRVARHASRSLRSRRGVARVGPDPTGRVVGRVELCRSDGGRTTSRTGRRVEYAAAPRRSLLSGHVGVTRRTTALRGWRQSTVELCRSDNSTCRYGSTTRVGPRRVARLDAPGPGSCLSVADRIAPTLALASPWSFARSGQRWDCADHPSISHTRA